MKKQPEVEVPLELSLHYVYHDFENILYTILRCCEERL